MLIPKLSLKIIIPILDLYFKQNVKYIFIFIVTLVKITYNICLSKHDFVLIIMHTTYLIKQFKTKIKHLYFITLIQCLVEGLILIHFHLSHCEYENQHHVTY